MKHLLVLCLFFFNFLGFGHAQIEFSENLAIKNLQEAWVQSNFDHSKIEGWRVQIFATNDLRKAEEVKGRFSANYPELPIDWVQEYPYYKIRVGAFLEKKETRALLSTLSDTFPSAFAIKDTKISVRDFISHW